MPCVRYSFFPISLLSLLLAAPACQPEPAPPASVIIIGIDGADWDVLDPLIAAGRLPSLAWMREHGATSDEVISSAMSPESWTTLATGHLPAQHGIVQDQANPAATFAASPTQLKVKRLWDMAGERGKRCLVVDYWVTAPPYPINGVLVSRESSEAWPAGAERLSLEPINPPEDQDLMKELGLSSSRTGTMKAYMAQGGFDLMVLPIYSVDHALHQLWSEFQVGLDPQAMATLSPERAAEVKRGHELVVQSAWIADTLLGHAYHAIDPGGYVMVVSDHGFNRSNPATRRLALSRRLLDGGAGTAEEGLFQLAQSRITLTPREERRKGPVPELDFLLRYPVVSLEGEDASLLRERLLAARTPDGAPLLETQGSVLVPSVAALTLTSEVLGGVQEDAFSVFVNTGSHNVSDLGVFGIYGPDVVPGPMDELVSSADLTPTALWLMGLPVGEDMAGRPAVQAFTRAAQRARPVTTIPTWEDGVRPWAVPGRTPLSDEELERLKALGYVH